MSGIFGLWRLDGHPVEATDLERMSHGMELRGPDGVHTWASGSLALGHAALHTTARARPEPQPLSFPAGVLVCDARIDNRDELLARLGDGPAQGSDADLLRAAYERWGKDAARHLRGDFAFVVWDSARRELVCVRDHFGVRPLYYAYVPGRLFAFASQIQALLALADVASDVDESTIARHLRIPIPDDSRRTYYREVRRALPASLLIVGVDGVNEAPYWEIDPTHELVLSSVDEYAEALRDAFVEAVRCRLRGDGPVGAMLSGGIDSSAIACVAARLLREAGASPLHTFSGIYPRVPASDERADIDEILDGLDAIPHFLEADAVSPIAGFDAIHRLVGGAVRARNIYLNWELNAAARAAGVRVVLDGFDGDSVVSHGWGYLNELAIAGQWLRLARVSIPFSRRRGTPPWSDFRALVAFGRRRRRVRAGRSEGRVSLPRGIPLNPDFATRFEGAFEPPEFRDTERKIHAAHLQSAILREVLGWLEACGAGREIEVRFPFFDVRVVELCVSMPANQKLRGGWTRFVMRKALDGIVPRSVQWRTRKANMYLGWNRAYREFAAPGVRALLARPNPAVEAYLDVGRVRELHERFVSGETNETEEASLWQSVSLALWLSPHASAPQPPLPSSSMSPRSSSSRQ